MSLQTLYNIYYFHFYMLGNFSDFIDYENWLQFDFKEGSFSPVISEEFVTFIVAVGICLVFCWVTVSCCLKCMPRGEKVTRVFHKETMAVNNGSEIGTAREANENPGPISRHEELPRVCLPLAKPQDDSMGRDVNDLEKRTDEGSEHVEEITRTEDHKESPSIGHDVHSGPHPEETSPVIHSGNAPREHIMTGTSEKNAQAHSAISDHSASPGEDESRTPSTGGRVDHGPEKTACVPFGESGAASSPDDMKIIFKNSCGHMCSCESLERRDSASSCSYTCVEQEIPQAAVVASQGGADVCRQCGPSSPRKTETMSASVVETACPCDSAALDATGGPGNKPAELHNRCCATPRRGWSEEWKRDSSVDGRTGDVVPPSGEHTTCWQSDLGCPCDHGDSNTEAASPRRSQEEARVEKTFFDVDDPIAQCNGRKDEGPGMGSGESHLAGWMTAQDSKLRMEHLRNNLLTTKMSALERRVERLEAQAKALEGTQEGWSPRRTPNPDDDAQRRLVALRDRFSSKAPRLLAQEQATRAAKEDQPRQLLQPPKRD